MRVSVAKILLFAASIAVTTPALAETDPVRATVQQLDDSLIGIMKAQGNQRSRAAQITPAIERAFDLPLMTRLAVGPSWNTIAPADQQALLAAFRRLTVAQYAANFDSWSGETFAIAPQIEARGTDRLVRTSLNVPGKEGVAIAYRLRQTEGRWQIIDIFYRNAISQIALRRSDFAAVLAKGGAKALTAHLDSLSAKGNF
jgi:phospholipid transport system substrate-binding protein